MNTLQDRRKTAAFAFLAPILRYRASELRSGSSASMVPAGQRPCAPNGPRLSNDPARQNLTALGYTTDETPPVQTGGGSDGIYRW